MKNKTLLIAVVFLVLTVFWTVFIWSFSFKDAVASTQDSNKVVEIVNEVIEKVTGKESNIGSYLIRKLGHFLEYSVLGVLLFLTIHFFGAKGVIKRYAISALPAVFVSVTDECIQLFSDGRSAQVSDVLLDLTGVITGFTVTLLVLRLCFKKIKL